MKFLLRLAALSIVLQVSFCAMLKLPKRDNVLKSIFQNLIRDNELSGFLVCNLIAKNKTAAVVAKSNEILRQVSLQTTVSQIDSSFTKNLHQFKRDTTRFPSTRSTLMHSHADVTQNNESFVSYDPRDKAALKDHLNISWVRRTPTDKYLLDNMLTHINKSVPSTLETVGIPFPTRIKINDKGVRQEVEHSMHVLSRIQMAHPSQLSVAAALELQSTEVLRERSRLDTEKSEDKPKVD